MCGSKLNYERRKPELTLLFQIIAGHWETFKAEREMEGRAIPKYIAEEFENYLRCGILAYGFGRVYCEACEHEKLVAFSCKGRGFCPSCGARRMAEAAIYLTDELVPLVPVRQFVVTFPPPLRLWLARSNELASVVCCKIMDALTAHLRRESETPNGMAGAVVFMQRFGSGANLNVHLLWGLSSVRENLSHPAQSWHKYSALIPFQYNRSNQKNSFARQPAIRGQHQSAATSDLIRVHKESAPYTSQRGIFGRKEIHMVAHTFVGKIFESLCHLTKIQTTADSLCSKFNFQFSPLRKHARILPMILLATATIARFGPALPEIRS